MSVVQSQEPPAAAESESSHGGIPRIASEQLLGPRGELVIEHQGREYRLRRTQNGKLILTA